jgi:hypothetical protein
MNSPIVWARALLIFGLTGMIIGAVHPLEDSLLILVGVGLVALAALLGKSRYRVVLCWAFALVVFGVTTMSALSRFGGVGGDTTRSFWWAVSILPYVVGWLVGLTAGFLSFFEVFKDNAGPTQAFR